jgi:hypothetical protein
MPNETGPDRKFRHFPYALAIVTAVMALGKEFTG